MAGELKASRENMPDNGNFAPQMSKGTMTIQVLRASERNKDKPVIETKIVPTDFYCPTPGKLPLFHRIKKGETWEDALRSLDAEVQEYGQKLLLEKPTHAMFGHNIPPGYWGEVKVSGRPRLVPNNGNVWTPAPNESFVRAVPMDNIPNWEGVTTKKFSDNECVVITRPNGQVIPVQHADGFENAFISYDLRGKYDVLDTVDRVFGGTAIKDPDVDTYLGQFGFINGRDGNMAMTYLKIPTAHVAILSRGDDLEMVSGTNLTITDPDVKFVRFFTTGIQPGVVGPLQLQTSDSADVKVSLMLQWHVENPLMLARHNYVTPFSAIADPARNALRAIVGSQSYRDSNAQLNLGGDPARSGLGMPQADPNAAAQMKAAAFDRAVNSEIYKDLEETFRRNFGISLDRAQIHERTFSGKQVEALHEQTAKAIRTWGDAALADQENATANKRNAGLTQQALETAKRLDALAKGAADAERRKGEGIRARTEEIAAGEANALLIKTKAQVAALASLARADHTVQSMGAQAQVMQQRRNAVELAAQLGNKTMILTPEAAGLTAQGTALGLGMQAAAQGLQGQGPGALSEADAAQARALADEEGGFPELDAALNEVQSTLERSSQAAQDAVLTGNRADAHTAGQAALAQ